MMANDQPSAAMMMAELQHIRAAVDANSKHLEKITHELAGNGGPGMRTRIYTLETGYNHAVERLRILESKHDELIECSHDLEEKINRMQGIGAGVALGVVILEALRWIIPLFTP